MKPGTRLGFYLIEREIGSGGMGTVFASEDTRSGRKVAIKILQRVFADDPLVAQRFDREARALTAVRHHNIVDILEVGVCDDGRPFLVMPLLSGRTLRDALAEQNRLTTAEIWAVLREVAAALEAAHAAGVIHRDLKPDNIFLVNQEDGTRTARLLDFGIAKVVAHSKDIKLTNTGTPLGTPGYMSPEQWWNESVTAQTDQYALGAVAFEMLSGRLPYIEEHYVALMQAHLSLPVPSLASVGSTVTPAIEQFVARLLSKNASDRFESIRALIDEGDRAFGVPSKPTSSPVPLALAISGLWPLAAIGVGYAGIHNPIEWSHIAGLGFYPIVLSFLIGIVFIALRRPGASRNLAIISGVNGTFGAYLGWRVVLDALEHFPAAQRFEIFNDGMTETNANRFVGFLFASTLTLASIALTRRTPVSRESKIVAIAFSVLGIAAVLARAPSAALVALTACISHLFLGPIARNRSEEIRHGAIRVLATAFMAASSLSAVDARASSVWAESLTRSARVERILSASAEHNATVAIALSIVVATAAFAVVRVLRAPHGTPIPLTTLQRATLSFFILWIGLDATFQARVIFRRAQLWAELAPQFDLFARLDPPSAQSLPSPSVAPSLRISRDVVAIDSTRVGLTRALTAPEASSALALDLSHRLAREEVLDEAVQLSVMVDRSVRWESVIRVLHVAHGVGVRRIEILLTRGPTPPIRADAPPEASYALPHDFGAISAQLNQQAGLVFSRDATFNEVAQQLAQASVHGVVDLKVD